MSERCRKIVEDSVIIFNKALHDDKLLEKVEEVISLLSVA